MERSDLLLRLGIVLEACGEFDAAHGIFTEALPGLSVRRRPLGLQRDGLVLLRLDKPGPAVEALQEAASLAPKDLENRWGLARALAANDQRNEAIKEYEAILRSFGLSEEGQRIIREELGALLE